MSDFFEIQGATGVIRVPKGEYYFNTKARARRMMLNSLTSEARQVYACLELATMGFQQELAVTMANGKRVPLTRSHIAQMTGLDDGNVRRGLTELEGEGLAERRGINGGPLHKGRIEIYCWAEPREPKKKRESRATPIPVWFPTSWEPLKPLIKRLKLNLLSELESIGGPEEVAAVLAQGEECALALQNAEMGVARFLKGVCAPTAIYKDEITEITEITTSSGGRAVPVESRPPEEEPPARPIVNQPENGTTPTHPPEWHGKLRKILKPLSPPTEIDEPMFQQIAGTLTEELLDQFQDACEGTGHIRKWSGILTIARQVAARGPVKILTAVAGGESPFIQKLREQVERSKTLWPTKT